MPTSTARHRFEFLLFEWARGFSRSLCGDRRSFFVGLRPDGSIRRIYFARPEEPFDGDRKSALADAHPAWFLFSPYDEDDAGYLEWLELPDRVAERWIGRAFAPEDFVDVRTTAARERWPRSWRVIVG